MTDERPILIVEDEPKLATLMQDYLTAAGHASCAWTTACM